MNKVTLIIRILFGVILLVFGLNKFIGFMEMPAFDGAAGTYMGGLAASGFTFKVIGMVEILTGVSMLSNKFVSLTLVLMAPISVNILLFHSFLDPAGLPVGAAVFIFNLVLLISRRKEYSNLLAA